MSELTLEKARVVERLTNVESEIKSFVELKRLENQHIQEASERHAQLLERITSTIYGNGQKGLLTTLSGHEQVLRLMIWVMGITCASTFTLGIRAIFQAVFVGKFP